MQMQKEVLSLHLLYFFCFRQRNALSYVQNILLIKMCVHTELEVATYVNTCNCALLFFPILFQKQLSIQAIHCDRNNFCAFHGKITRGPLLHIHVVQVYRFFEFFISIGVANIVWKFFSLTLNFTIFFAFPLVRKSSMALPSSLLAPPLKAFLGGA